MVIYVAVTLHLGRAAAIYSELACISFHNAITMDKFEPHPSESQEIVLSIL
jgi:hypothetical protein